ncbi:hydroxymethylglutaryl-CoA lyase [Gordonia sinesedis]
MDGNGFGAGTGAGTDDGPGTVVVRDVAMRDGLQIEEPISTRAKLELLDAIVATGVREVEVTAFVSPTKVPALADAAEIATHLDRFADTVDFSALVASVTGAHRALDAGLRNLEYVVSASDAHSRANVGRGSDDSATLIDEIVSAAHESDGRVEVIVATAWDCPFDGPTPPERVESVIARAVAAGADRISIADTIGTTTPRRVTELIERVRPLLDGRPLGAHFHNTRGTGLASAYAAVQAGVRRLDASAGGLGGCPFAPGASGNIATEDLVYLLRDSGTDTGIDLPTAIAAGRVAVALTGGGAGSALMRAGDRLLS